MTTPYRTPAEMLPQPLGPRWASPFSRWLVRLAHRFHVPLRFVHVPRRPGVSAGPGTCRCRECTGIMRDITAAREGISHARAQRELAFEKVRRLPLRPKSPSAPVDLKE